MLTLLIPTHEEYENIGPLIERLNAVRALLDEPLEVLVVDSDSHDGTADRARALLAPEGIGRVIQVPERCDLAQAVREGIRQASGDLIGLMDADLSHPPELLPALVGAIRAGSEVVVASRYAAGAQLRHWPRRRRVLSRLANWLVRPLVPVADATSGYFVCRAPLVKSLTMQPRGFKILVDILVRGCVHQVREIPYTFTDRLRGSSKLDIRVMWYYLVGLTRLYCYRWRHPCQHANRTRPMALPNPLESVDG